MWLDQLQIAAIIIRVSVRPFHVEEDFVGLASISRRRNRSSGPIDELSAPGIELFQSLAVSDSYRVCAVAGN